VNAAVVKMPPVRDPVSEGITRIENQDRDKAKAKMEFGSFVKECREEREKTKWIQSVQRAEFPPVLHPKTVMDYTQLINFYRLKKNFDMVKTIWEVMLARNIIPSQHTYSSLIAACLIPIHDRTWNNQEDSRYNEFKVLEAIKLAESAFDHAVAGPERPNLYVINAMLSVYARRGMFVEAVWLFNRLRADFYHVQPDVITYTCVLDACFRGGEFEHGWRLFDDYEVMNPIMDPKCYIVAMRACIFARDPHRAISLFNDMVRVGYIPTTYHFNILLNACILDKEHYPLAFDFLKRMISSHDYLPDRVSFHTLLQGCRLHRDLPRALAVMKLAESLADGSTFVCMNQVISATMQEEFVSPGEDKKPLSKDDRVQVSDCSPSTLVIFVLALAVLLSTNASAADSSYNKTDELFLLDNC
jgi:pentatricopeptide repeat protein